MAGIPVVGHDAGWVPLNGRSLAAIFAIVRIYVEPDRQRLSFA
jgi:hypothetical protein